MQNDRPARRGPLPTLGLAALAASLLAAALWLWPAAPAGEEAVALSVTQLSVGDVQAVVLKNGSGAVSLLNLPTGVVVDGGDASVYAQDKLTALIYNLAHLEAAGTVAPAEDDRYGFASPSAQVSLLLEDGTVRLTLGRACPVGEGYYLRTDQSDEIYRIDSQMAAQMLQSADDLRDLRLYPALSSADLGKLSAILLEHDGSVMELQQLQTDTASTFFGMVQPVVSALDWEKVYRQLLSPLMQLQPQRFAGLGEDLAPYGLDEPEYTLTLLLDGTVYRCAFTQKDADTWYCTRLGSGLVSEVDAESAAFLQLDFMDLIGSSLYTRSVADLSGLDARFEGRRFTLDITGEGDSLTAALPGRQLDREELLAFYQKIDTIPAAAQLTGEEIPADEPALVMTFALRSGGEDILEFYPISDRQCAVYINGQAEFSTYTTVVEELKKAWNQVGM